MRPNTLDGCESQSAGCPDNAPHNQSLDVGGDVEYAIPYHLDFICYLWPTQQNEHRHVKHRKQAVLEAAYYKICGWKAGGGATRTKQTNRESSQAHIRGLYIDCRVRQYSNWWLRQSGHEAIVGHIG